MVSEVVDDSEQDSPADDEPPEAEEVPAQASSSEVSAPASRSEVPPAAQPATPTAEPVPRRSNRENRGVPPSYMADMLMLATMESSDSEPKTYKQAMKLPEFGKWLEARAAEVASLVENQVF